MMTTLAMAAGFAGGRLQGSDRRFAGVSTDTRSLRDGELFVALSGPNFDGGDYLAEAARRGAAGAMVAAPRDEPLSQITVDDTRLALGRLGAGWRRQQSAVVVGITGSNGKTTLKELTAACLKQVAPTLATEGNLNNDIGMPLMMTRIDDSHRYAVLEMGANHAGEIAYLCSLAEPDVVAITNAGAAHLEGFGSVEGVARAKGEILQSSVRPGVAVLNADDPWFDYWRGLVGDIECISFGLGENAAVRASQVVANSGGSTFRLDLPDGAIDVRLSLPGRHNVRNACAAAAIAAALGIAPAQIQGGLETVRPVQGRLQPLPGPRGAMLYNDSYNANPLSVVAAAEFLASLEGIGVLVLGDMGELGDDAALLHREVGEAALKAGVDRLFAIGEFSRHTVKAFGVGAQWFAGLEELVTALDRSLAPGTNVLVKGSRFMRMERVLDALGADTGGRH
jgi:UDP-N-acetylmuramoyl-tripeptide--D-alanyl-D-alanine ligase